MIIDSDGDLLTAINESLKPYPLIRVSSKYLKLASPVFKDLLEGSAVTLECDQCTISAAAADESPWAEGAKDVVLDCIHSDARILFLYAYWDTFNSMTVITNILHGRHNDVPKNMDCNELANVADIVQYYRLMESVSVHVNTWLSEEVVTSYLSRDFAEDLDEAHSLLSIAVVFERPDLARRVSKLVSEQIEEPLEEDSTYNAYTLIGKLAITLGSL
ncbi:MAG: hypothetical protein MMC23_007491 [Stictis urceolatum]|nr:hypothetical protein [Stictis urceolata]